MFFLKFIVGNGEQLNKRLEDISVEWVNDFLNSKILVIAVMNENTIAAYGIRGILNVASVYVKEGYRHLGISKQVRDIAFDEARKRGIDFIIAEISFHHLFSRYGIFLSTKFGCREIKRLQRHKASIVVFPLNAKGRLAYMFLRMVFSVVPSALLEPISELVWKRTRGQ